MPKNNASHLPDSSNLHRLLEGHPVSGLHGNIDVFKRFTEIKNDAQTWLEKHDKNGYEHSERLEHYLDGLTRGMVESDRKLLTHGEAFVVLCAVYMHDLGYRYNNELVPAGHPERSRLDTWLPAW